MDHAADWHAKLGPPPEREGTVDKGIDDLLVEEIVAQERVEIPFYASDLTPELVLEVALEVLADGLGHCSPGMLDEVLRDELLERRRARERAVREGL